MIKQTAVGIIPARFGASRLPGKPLVDLRGKSMIRRVWEGARESSLLNRVIVATDDERIAAECFRIGAEAVMTPPELPSGTDRILYANRFLAQKFDIIVNIQGDEPLLRGSVIDELLFAAERSSADVITPVKRIISAEELLNPSVVKVAMNGQKRALYFSRSPIPHFRGSTEPKEWLKYQPYWKHIGLYAYRSAALERFGDLAPSPLEQAEQLEQLRLMEDGASFECVETHFDFVAIDTPEDVERVRKILG